MAIQTQWDDGQNKVIRVEVEGRWSWDELQTALKHTIELMDSVPHKVDFIIDVSRSSLIPGGATQAAQSVATPETHRNEGIKVVVGSNALMRIAYEAYRRINSSLGKNQEFLFAKSREDARTLIFRERSSVP
jgi:hypothetical protein